MSSLHLLMGDDEDAFPPCPHEEEMFTILRDYLQPDTRLSLKSTANSILDLLPENENEPRSMKAWDFVCHFGAK